MNVPGYWMNETSGVLRPVVEAYLKGGNLNPEQIVTMRAYLRQWIMAPAWRGVENLRRSVDNIRTQADLDHWLDRALNEGIDPF